MNYFHFMQPRLDLKQLHTFLVLARTQSFTEAGRLLHRTQSAVSHAIKRLEASVGHRLVSANRRPFRLTDEGRRLLEASEGAFSLLDGAMEDIARRQGHSLGRLRLGVTVEFGYSILMKHMEPFIKSHPDIDMEFRLGHELLEPLLRDELDAIIDCTEHTRRGLASEVLFREDYAVVASSCFVADHELASPADLAHCTVLTLDREANWWQRFLVALPAKKRPDFSRLLPINHIRAMVVAAIHGIGVALVPRYCVLTELAEGSLEHLFPALNMFEDRFVLYQKRSKVRLLRHRELTSYLGSLELSEFGDD